MKNTLQETQEKVVKARFIGVVSAGLANPHAQTMLDEITRQLNARGYLTLLLNADAQDCYATLRQKAEQLPVEGWVYLSNRFDDAAILDHHAVSSVYLCHTQTPSESISSDDYAAGFAIGNLLLEQQYQRLGFMQSHNTLSSPSKQMQGYIASLNAADKMLKVVLTAEGYEREQAYQAMMTYLKKTRAAERIEALYCENDLLAFGAMQAIRDFGQGTHIAIVGCGDVDEARSSTWHLTTWTQRVDLLVTEALNRLLEQRADEQGAWRQGELQIRHSHLGKEVLGEMTKCGCASRH